MYQGVGDTQKWVSRMGVPDPDHVNVRFALHNFLRYNRDAL
jgi:hypothetical protein